MPSRSSRFGFGFDPLFSHAATACSPSQFGLRRSSLACTSSTVPLRVTLRSGVTWTVHSKLRSWRVGLVGVAVVRVCCWDGSC